MPYGHIYKMDSRGNFMVHHKEGTRPAVLLGSEEKRFSFHTIMHYRIGGVGENVYFSDSSWWREASHAEKFFYGSVGTVEEVSMVLSDANDRKALVLGKWRNPLFFAENNQIMKEGVLVLGNDTREVIRAYALISTKYYSLGYGIEAQKPRVVTEDFRGVDFRTVLEAVEEAPRHPDRKKLVQIISENMPRKRGF